MKHTKCTEMTKAALCAYLLLVLLSFFAKKSQATNTQELRIIHIPVNSGDCALVVFPTGKLMMIDTGTENRFNKIVLPFLERHCINHIDYLMKSHNHGDHIGGVATMEKIGMVDSSTTVWDATTFDYEDTFTVEGVNFFVYNTKDIQLHGRDVNYNSLAVRMEYNGWVYTTGGDEGLVSMKRFLNDHPSLVRAHVRKIAHHMWGPLSTEFLRQTDAHLYITTNKRWIIGMESPWDDWESKFIPEVVDYARANGGRIDDPGYALTGMDGFIYITVKDGDDWNYATDEFNGKSIYIINDWTMCKNLNRISTVFRSSNVPRTMIVNETAVVSIRMKNTGDVAWTRAGLFRLVSRSPVGNSNWGLQRVELEEGVTVTRGTDHTFSFSIRSPSVPGIYTFQWQMNHGGSDGDGDFGRVTPKIEIVVLEEQASCFSQCSCSCSKSYNPVIDTVVPTRSPTKKPTVELQPLLTKSPTEQPTLCSRNILSSNFIACQQTLTKSPTTIPTIRTTTFPTMRPTERLPLRPTTIPTIRLTEIPTLRPTERRLTLIPTQGPTKEENLTTPTRSPLEYSFNNPILIPTGSHPILIAMPGH